MGCGLLVEGGSAGHSDNSGYSFSLLWVLSVLRWPILQTSVSAVPWSPSPVYGRR